MTHPSLQDVQPSNAASGTEHVVVLCGSFRRDPDGLRDAREQLIAAGVTVLSPVDLAFVGEEDGFVFAAHEADLPPAVVEDQHVVAMQAADFIWLHAPDGYVGPSAAMELGIAHALSLPVYTATAPADPVFAGFVTVVSAPADAVAECSVNAQAPIRGLTVLQEYYGRAASRRGWSDETPEQTLLLLMEELGELSRAMRTTQNGVKHVPDEDPALELADVTLYALHLANVLSVDLAAAVAEKEKLNAIRFEARGRRAA